MSEKKEKIINAVNTVKELGYELSNKVTNEINNLENPNYNVAVVGQYQVGKSTLINKVFLNDNPILVEGNGLCTTSVATSIMYGNENKLEIYKWDEKYKEVLSDSILSPTQGDIIKHTSCINPNERTNLASSISKVCVYTPNDILRKYTVIDTPGIDDPNKELLINTTYRVIPASDLAVLVVAPKMLDTIELNLLHNKLISDGVSKVVVLVSYNPESPYCKSVDQRANVVETIKAQLKNYGLEVGVAMYCYNESFKDILCTPQQIKDYLNKFLCDNASEGRENKVALVVKAELENIVLELSTKLKLIDNAEEEKEIAKAKLKCDIENYKEKCESLFVNFENNIECLKKQYVKKYVSIISNFVNDTKQDISNAKDVDVLRETVNNIETEKDKLASKFEDVSNDLYNEVQSTITKLTESEDNSLNASTVEVEDVAVSDVKSFIPNSVLISALNVVILNPIVPLGWITALIAHLISNKYINPAAFIVGMINKHFILNQLDKIEEDAKINIINNVENYFSSLVDQIHVEYNAYCLDKVRAMERVLEDNNIDSADKDRIIANKNVIEAFIKAL